MPDLHLLQQRRLRIHNWVCQIKIDLDCGFVKPRPNFVKKTGPKQRMRCKLSDGFFTDTHDQRNLRFSYDDIKIRKRKLTTPRSSSFNIFHIRMKKFFMENFKLLSISPTLGP